MRKAPAKTDTLDAEEEIPTGEDAIKAHLANPSLILTNQRRFKALVEAVDAMIAEHEHDIKTVKGRTAIASLVRRVVTLRTSMEDARLSMTARWRQATTDMNEAGKRNRAVLEVLEAKAEGPLAEWTKQEKERKETCQAVIDRMRATLNIPLGATADEIRVNLNWVKGLNDVVPEVYGDLWDEADGVRLGVLRDLPVKIEVLEEAEKDAKDLAELRAKQERRDAADRQAAAEQMAKANEEENARRLVEAQAIAAAKAKADAEAEAERKLDEQAKAHQDELDRIERNRVAAEQRKEDDRIAEEKRAAAEKKRVEKEDAARAANVKHRKTVKTEAYKGLVAAVEGLTMEQGVAIINAIADGKVPHASMKF